MNFERYALDLSQAPTDQQSTRISARDRFFWELVNNDPAKTKLPAGQARAEMHERILAPIYPIVFTIITFAYLGAPRTTRQGRAMSVAGAAIAISVVPPAGLCRDRAVRSLSVGARDRVCGARGRHRPWPLRHPSRT